jgi:cob(I)alamin adenosyltransferase
MGIVTKTGDDGKSRWLNQVVEKDSRLLEAVGTIDELQAMLGVAKVRVFLERGVIESIQQDLWAIMGELAYKQEFASVTERTKEIEEEIKEMESELPKIENFLMPGEVEVEAVLNFSRAICRRAERRMVSLHKKKRFRKELMVYLNRLSDYLFTLGRVAREK